MKIATIISLVAARRPVRDVQSPGMPADVRDIESMYMMYEKTSIHELLQRYLGYSGMVRL